MARGGKRENAGRKAGALTVRTRETAQQAIAEGVTPLQVMLGNMRFYHEAGELALQRLLEGTAKPVDIIAEHDPKQLEAEDAAPNVIDAFKLLLALRDKAGAAARDAAQFVHARIAPIEAKAQRPEDTEIPLVERLKKYATADAIKQSGGKVVELKVSDRPAPTGRNKAKAR